MVQRCTRCERRYERDPDGGQCTTTTNGTDPCFRTGIRWLDFGEQDRDRGEDIAEYNTSDKGGGSA